MTQLNRTPEVQEIIDFIEAKLSVTIPTWQRDYLERCFSPTAVKAERKRLSKNALLKREIAEFGPILVIAYSHGEASSWASKYGLSVHDYRYIGKADDLRGYTGSHPRITLPYGPGSPRLREIRDALSIVDRTGKREPSLLIAELQFELDRDFRREAMARARARERRMYSPVVQVARPHGGREESAKMADPRPAAFTAEITADEIQDIVKSAQHPSLEAGA